MEAQVNSFETATAEVAAFLENRAEPGCVEARVIIDRYSWAIRPNFIPWMRIAMHTAQSNEARQIARDNLEAEVREKHPDMLDSFTRSCGIVEPGALACYSVAEPVAVILRLVSECSGLKNIALMAALESLSLAFIPYLRKLGDICNAADLEYIDKHGVADIEHAKALLEAVEAEKPSSGNQNEDVSQAITVAKNLIFAVFA